MRAKASSANIRDEYSWGYDPKASDYDAEKHGPKKSQSRAHASRVTAYFDKIDMSDPRLQDTETVLPPKKGLEFVNSCLSGFIPQDAMEEY